MLDGVISLTAIRTLTLSVGVRPPRGGALAPGRLRPVGVDTDVSTPSLRVLCWDGFCCSRGQESRFTTTAMFAVAKVHDDHGDDQGNQQPIISNPLH